MMKFITILKTSTSISLLALLSCGTDDINEINEPTLPEVVIQTGENDSEANISYTSIEINGVVVSDGGSEISSYGVVGNGTESYTG